MDQEFTSAAQEPSRTERWMESCEEEQGWRLLPPVLCTTARSSAVSVCPCLAASSAGSRVWSCWSIPRAVLCVLPEPCFDKWVHSQPAQLGSLTLSSCRDRLVLQSCPSQRGAVHPRHCHRALGTPDSP